MNRKNKFFGASGIAYCVLFIAGTIGSCAVKAYKNFKEKQR